jgi:hypothetical protein
MYIFCRWFFQWKERKQIKFSFGRFEFSHTTAVNNTDTTAVNNTNTTAVNNTNTTLEETRHTSIKGSRKVVLQLPKVYSYRIQNDEVARNYYIPLMMNSKSEWLCAYPSIVTRPCFA